MDGIGIRDALFDMAERMAEHGYCVLLPNMFYRHGPYEPFDLRRCARRARKLRRPRVTEGLSAACLRGGPGRCRSLVPTQER